MNRKLEAVGSRLKKARSKKAVSLDEVYEKTKIHPRILEALEEDRGEEILSSVYLRSFLKGYSQYLGLGNDELIKKALAQHAPSVPVKPVLAEEKPGVKIEVRKFILPLISVLSIFFLIFVIGFAGLKLISKFRNLIGRTHPALSEKETPIAPKLKGAFRPIPGDKDLVLELETSGEVWVEVKSDGKIVFRHVLPEGSLEKWKAGDSIELWVGKAEAVELSLNGQELGSPGSGVVKNIRFTRKGMRIGE